MTPEPTTLPADTHPCPCRAEHAPQPAWTHRHHILPLSEGGTDVEDNVAIVCPATHDWIHVILRAFAKAEGDTSRRRGWPTHAYALALEGWSRMQSAGPA